MENSKEDNENFDKIKVFSSEDEKLKILGELLSNKSSRDIIKLLIDKEMYTNQIAKEAGIKMNLVLHHLKKLEELGLVTITHKKIIRNGIDHKYYRMIPNLLVVSNQDKKEIHENGFLKKFFKEGIKLASVFLAAIVITQLFRTSPVNETENIDNIHDFVPDLELTKNISNEPEISGDIIWSIIITTLIISVTLIIIFIKKRKGGIID